MLLTFRAVLARSHLRDRGNTSTEDGQPVGHGSLADLATPAFLTASFMVARSRGKIPFAQGFDFVEVLLERLPHHPGQDRVAVFNFRKLKLRTGRALI